nr:hypothetical protein [Tanacetum cinerariifolium]
VNEEMMETLFTANSSKPAPNHRTNRHVATNMNQKIRVLDPHKSRNIAILLRAFNLTIDEVCESILQGNVDTVDAMLYISNFDTEVEYLKASFETIKAACRQLKNSRMFITDDLRHEYRKLAMGLTKIREVVALNEQSCSNDSFLDSMTMFLKKAEADIVNIKDEERVTILMVKDITEYFHGCLTTEEENQPLWIFMVVRDFLLVLDRVCKEVGKINERTTVGSQSLPPSVFPSFNNGRRGFSSF